MNANPFLVGNFAPLREETTVEPVTVIGQIPTALNGLYVRNGPNPHFAPRGRYHWLDGDGMLHAVRLHEGRASYCNRYVQTQALTVEQRQEQALWTGLFETPWRNWWNWLRYGTLGKNPANTALVWHAGRLLALWEYGKPYQIAPNTLATVRLHTFGERLSCNFTAHPKVDASTGELLFFGYNLFRPPYLHYGIVSAAGDLVRIEPIPLPHPVIMHDFAITEHYTIFMDLPLVFELRRILHRQVPLRFAPERPARFGIMPRHGTAADLRWFPVDPCFVYHTLNAYEQGDEVIVVGCRMTDTNLFQPPVREESRLHRWRFNRQSGAVHEEALSDQVAELPQVNNAYIGRPTRYGYTAQYQLCQQAFTGVVKDDLQSGSCVHHPFGPQRFGGEAVFAPRPGATAEDDGWLLTFVYDGARNASELLILHAQDVAGEPAARVLLPQRVPYGFHGLWVDATKLSQGERA